jgi:hypothetical protein
MSASLHLTHLVPTRERPQTGGLARMRVRLRRASLDHRLAAGADPATDDDLAIRAEELCTTATRARIAAVILRLIDEAADPPPPFSSQAPLARPAIMACSPRLRAIAGRLKSDRRLAPAGIAQAAMLVREGTSPLYSLATTETSLRHRLAEIAEALG